MQAVQRAQDRISNIERTLNKFEFDDARLDIERVVGESGAFKATPFSAAANDQSLRDSYFDAQFLHYRLLQRLEKRSEALEVSNADCVAVVRLG